MLRMRGRLNKLERVLVPSKGPQKRIRLVICAMTKAADLATSTCYRSLANGVLTEVVHLDGDGRTFDEVGRERRKAAA